jgi:hypothetical protein
MRKADPLDRLLLNAVEHGWRVNAAHFVDRRHDVDRVQELVAQAPLVLDALGPRDNHGIARAPEMARDLLRPLEGRVHRMRPGGRKMVEVLRAA